MYDVSRSGVTVSHQAVEMCKAALWDTLRTCTTVCLVVPVCVCVRESECECVFLGADLNGVAHNTHDFTRTATPDTSHTDTRQGQRQTHTYIHRDTHTTHTRTHEYTQARAHALQFLPKGHPEYEHGDAFVITGDINDLWIRDSAAQVHPYIPLTPRNATLARLVEGLAHRHAFYIDYEPYANAYR